MLLVLLVLLVRWFWLWGGWFLVVFLVGCGCLVVCGCLFGFEEGLVVGFVGLFGCEFFL